jgi:hypothetical protein
MTGGVEEYAERFGRILQEGYGRVFPFLLEKYAGEVAPFHAYFSILHNWCQFEQVRHVALMVVLR